jgi:nucleoside diphosphate kinase
MMMTKTKRQRIRRFGVAAYQWPSLLSRSNQRRRLPISKHLDSRASQRKRRPSFSSNRIKMRRRKKKRIMQRTLAIVKPDVTLRLGKQGVNEIMAALSGNGFNVVGGGQWRTLSKQRAQLFYLEHCGRFFYQRLVAFMHSGPIAPLVLEAPNAIDEWRRLIGPTNRQLALNAAPDCLRVRFGTSDTQNALHGSDSPDTALREIEFFFGSQI